MLTIILSKPEFYPNSGIPAVFGSGIPAGIPAGVVRNTSGMLAIIPAEFRWNASNNSGRILAGIPVEYQRNAGNNSGGILAGISVEYWQNAGNNSGGFQRNSNGIRPASTWNSGKVRTGIPAGFHRNSGSVFTRV